MSEERIDLLVASRGRPHRLHEMIASAYKTATHRGALQVLVRVDEDDPHVYDYTTVLAEGWLVRYIKGARKPVPALMGDLQSLSHAPILFQGSDDILFRTDGWDERVRGVYRQWPDRLFIASPNSGFGRDKCEHFAYSREWARIVGTEGWTEFRHFYLDQWMEELARPLGRWVFMRDVVAEHMHAKYKKADNDATYQAKRVENFSGQDGETYAGLTPVRQAQLDRLRAALRA